MSTAADGVEPDFHSSMDTAPEGTETQNWAVQMQARMVTVAQRHPCPPGVAPGFWQMLTLYAAQHNGLAQLCLEHGKAWTHEHRRTTPRGLPKQCFRNATELVFSQPGLLTYVEGFGCTAKLGLALPHAWAVDQDGCVLDPTWEDGISYCGLGVKIDALLKITGKSKVWGVFGEFTPSWVVTDRDRWLATVNGLPASRTG